MTKYIYWSTIDMKIVGHLLALLLKRKYMKKKTKGWSEIRTHAANRMYLYHMYLYIGYRTTIPRLLSLLSIRLLVDPDSAPQSVCWKWFNLIGLLSISEIRTYAADQLVLCLVYQYWFSESPRGFIEMDSCCHFNDSHRSWGIIWTKKIRRDRESNLRRWS